MRGGRMRAQDLFLEFSYFNVHIVVILVQISRLGAQVLDQSG